MKPITQFSLDRADFVAIPSGARNGEERDDRFANFLKFFEGKVSPDTPYVATEYISGPEFSCNVIARHGKVIALSVSKSSAMQIDYDRVTVPGIDRWVDIFMSHHRLTGQYCFDFIRCNNGPEKNQVFAIECNPRAHSSLVLYDGLPRLEKAFFRALENSPLGHQVLPPERLPMMPKGDAPHVYWLYNEIGKLFRQEIDLFQFIFCVLRSKEAVFDMRDPMPFFALYCIQMPALLVDRVYTGEPWRVTNVCMGGLRY